MGGMFILHFWGFAFRRLEVTAQIDRCLRCPFPAVSFGSSERRIQLLRVMAMAHNRALLLAYFAWLAVCEAGSSPARVEGGYQPQVSKEPS